MRNAVLWVVMAGALLAQPALESFLAAPFAQNLVAAGNRVAWVVTDRGVRNVWVAEGPHWKGRAVTEYRDADGVDIGQLALAPEGVLYTRGGDLETFQENPNPGNLAVAPDQAVWFVSFAGGAPRRIGDGSLAVVSPAGNRILRHNKGAVYSTPLLGGTDELVLDAKVRAGMLRFSPDGTRLALVSGRRDHAFIGVYTFGAKSIQYLDASVDRDSEPVWSPDGKQIAFIRTAADTRAFQFGPERTAEPWSIRTADADTGRGREIWRAARGAGSVFSPVVGQSLVWAANGKLIFPWERSGWRQLYAIPAQGGSVRQLTQGAFEVEHVRATRDGVVFSSNEGDVERRHIWTIGETGERRALTKGAGIEWAPVQADDGTVLLLRSTWKEPSRPAVLTAGSMRDVATPAYTAGAAFVEPGIVSFTASDGLKISAQLFLPAGYQAGKKYPAVAFFHGGSRRQMVPAFHYMYYYANTYAMNQYLASRGFLVLSVNYRSGIGYGMEFREAEQYGATGASEFLDVRGAGEYLRARSDVDTAKIGLYGGSYGGYLTALGLSRASDLFAAGVDIHGVHDWNSVIQNFVPRYDSLRQPEVARLAFASSPLASVDTWKSPVLLIHGDDDRIVPFSETVRLVEALRKRGLEPEQLVFPDEVHDFLRFDRWVEAMRATEEFLGRKLK